jgi:mutator protein MutT
MEELTDVYDANGKRTGRTLIRGEQIGEEDYIQAAVAIVKSGKHVLVTKRHPKKSHGGEWEFPGGGSRMGEEPLDTLLRELEEETGIHACREQVSFLKTVYYARYHLFVYVHLVECEVNLGALRLQETEVTGAMLVTEEELSFMQSVMTPMNQQIYREIGNTIFPKTEIQRDIAAAKE